MQFFYSLRIVVVYSSCLQAAYCLFLPKATASPSQLQVLQEIPLVNATDAAFSASATLTGKGFSGPRDLSVPPKGTGVYPLSFCPPGSGTYTGTLELFIAATGERNVYNLVGKGGEPLAEGHMVIECQV